MAALVWAAARGRGRGTGSYGSALARHLAANGVTAIEVSRPNRQVRRRHGKTDVIDAIAAARAVLSGEASATPKNHNGPAEALRLLKIVQRSANKSRTQAVNQLRMIVATAPDELRSKLRTLKTTELFATCAAFRVRADDDDLAAVTRLALRELAQRIGLLDDQLARTNVRLRRITAEVAPSLWRGKASVRTLPPRSWSAPATTRTDFATSEPFAALARSNPIPASVVGTWDRPSTHWLCALGRRGLAQGGGDHRLKHRVPGGVGVPEGRQLRVMDGPAPANEQQLTVEFGESLRSIETNEAFVIGHQMISRVRRLAQEPPIPPRGGRPPTAAPLFRSRLPKPQRQRVRFSLSHTRACPKCAHANPISGNAKARIMLQGQRLRATVGERCLSGSFGGRLASRFCTRRLLRSAAGGALTAQAPGPR